MNTTILTPVDGRKSFYGKAVVYREGSTLVLRSYNTAVIAIYRGRIYRLWNGYSATTMRHINAFLDLYGKPGGGKKWWDALPVASASVKRSIREKMLATGIDTDVPGWAGYRYFS